MLLSISSKKQKKRVILLLMLATLLNVLYAQPEPPSGDYWSVDAGLGTVNALVKGLAYEFIVDPRISISPSLMLGTKTGVSYSTDEILAFEGQVYLRWNFLRWGNPEKPVNLFLQGGMGMLTTYRGTNSPFDDPTKSRGSLMADAAAGITIPLNSRWHIEPSIRGGYPHIAGVGLTAGYRFPLPQKTKYQRPLSSGEIIKQVSIDSVDSIIFGPNTEQYNTNIDQNVMELNDTILDGVAKTLKEHPDFMVRIEGHANPVIHDSAETATLITLSRMRADTIAELLKEKGITEKQMIVVAFGGAKPITNAAPNINRRVDLIVIHVNTIL